MSEARAALGGPNRRASRSLPYPLRDVPREPRELLDANLRAIAKRRGLSLDEVATRAGLSSAELLAIFDGRLDPDLGVLQALADAVGERLSALFFDPESDPRFH